MNILPQYAQSYQNMYFQLLTQYTTLSQHYHSIVRENNSLHDQLQQKLKEKIELMQPVQHNHKENTPSLQLQEQDSFLQITLQKNEKNKKVTAEPKQLKQSKNRYKTRISRSICPYPECKKIYGSSVSMNLHIKQKHNGGTKKQREAYARLLIESEQKNIPIDVEPLNLPPNFIEQFRKNYLYMKKYNM